MNKLQKIRELLHEKELDAMLITDPINRRYVSGFTGTAGIVLITLNDAFLITDFRYTEQAMNEATVFTIVEHQAAIQEKLKELISKSNVTKLGFEKHHVTYAEYDTYKKVLDIQLEPIGNVVETLRMIKTTEEIHILKKAAKIADEAFIHIQSYIKPGVKEIEIANELEFFMRKQGASSSSFDIIVASGHRSALPHGVASNKEIQAGELVTMDYGAIYQGYCSDITRTVAVGEITDQLKDIYHVVLEAQTKGVNEIKAHMTGKQADAIPRDFIESKGYGEYFGHSTGHGIGLNVHEEPRLSIKSNTTLLPGMVVTVEPGIYIPNIGGCRIEDDIVITKTGNERLTKAEKKLIQL